VSGSYGFNMNLLLNTLLFGMPIACAAPLSGRAIIAAQLEQFRIFRLNCCRNCLCWACAKPLRAQNVFFPKF
jgi:hypothetical protein